MAQQEPDGGVGRSCPDAADPTLTSSEARVWVIASPGIASSGIAGSGIAGSGIAGSGIAGSGTAAAGVRAATAWWG